MNENNIALLTSVDRYTKFICNGKTISFLHGKDLIKYISVKEWDNGYLVVECLGKIKGEYEDYIDISFILDELYMDSNEFLKNIKEVRIQYA